MNSRSMILIALLFDIASISGVSAKDSPTEIHANLLSKRVSMVQLLANPSEFHGKRVFVDGIMHHVYEDNTLYLTREMADCCIKANGIGLQFDEKSLTLIPVRKKPATDLDYFHNKLVSVYGTFSKDRVLTGVSVVMEHLPIRTSKNAPRIK